MSQLGATWRYRAEDLSGIVKSGVLEAVDEAAAITDLRARGLAPIFVECQKTTLFENLFRSAAKHSLPLSDVSAIARRLSDLLGAGLPLARAVDISAKHAVNDRQRLFFLSAAKQLGAGHSFSKAIAANQARLPPLMLAIVQSGEHIGDLPSQLKAAAAHYDELLRLRREIVAQLAYPAALLILIILTLVFLSFFVLPQFQSIFDTSGAEPPLETKIALAGGAFIRNYFYLTPLAIVAALILFQLFRERYTILVGRLMLAAPIVGRIKRDAEIGRYCRTLATALSGGMSLSDAMPLAAGAVTSGTMGQAVEETEREVRTGGRLADAIARNVNPSLTMVSFLEIGEETGELAAMAGEAARFAETQTRNAIKKSMSVLSPILTAIMGLVTAAVIAAVMSGVLSLNETML